MAKQERINQEFKALVKRMVSLRPSANLYDLKQCAETLINLATMLQHANEMACSHRVDLATDCMDNSTFDGAASMLVMSAKQIGEHYGLNVETGSGDPRGYALALVVPADVANCWGEPTHYAIPTVSETVFYA